MADYEFQQRVYLDTRQPGCGFDGTDYKNIS